MSHDRSIADAHYFTSYLKDHLGCPYGTDEAQKAKTVLSAANVNMCNLIPNKP